MKDFLNGSLIPGDDDLLDRVPILPLEFHGAAPGEDEYGQPVVSLLFRPIGVDALEVVPEDMGQVVVSRKNVPLVITVLKKALETPGEN